MTRAIRRAGARVLPLFLVGGCATAIESGPPLADPAAIAVRLASRTGAERPATLRLAWRYGDRRGDVRGEGVARFNPPDSLRLDLFTSGDVAMAVASAGGRLTSLGEIDEIEVPPRAFVFAMAGLFRPDGPEPPRGFLAGSDSVLVYGSAEGRTQVFFLRDGRLRRLEERRGGRVLRLVRLEWPVEGAWPTGAEFRDLHRPSRVRWTIESVRSPVARHPSEIYALPHEP
ncbi:MAG: hypothetical protein R6X22_07780 [Gemmatimonadota bacterium]